MAAGYAVAGYCRPGARVVGILGCEGVLGEFEFCLGRRIFLEELLGGPLGVKNI